MMKVKRLFVLLLMASLTITLSACSNDTNQNQDETLFEVPAIHGTWALESDDNKVVSYLFVVDTTNDEQLWSVESDDEDEEPCVYIYDVENNINEYGTYELINDHAFTFTTKHIDDGKATLKDGILTISYNEETYQLERKSKTLMFISNE